MIAAAAVMTAKSQASRCVLRPPGFADGFLPAAFADWANRGREIGSFKRFPEGEASPADWEFGHQRRPIVVTSPRIACGVRTRFKLRRT